VHDDRKPQDRRHRRGRRDRTTLRNPDSSSTAPGERSAEDRPAAADTRPARSARRNGAATAAVASADMARYLRELDQAQITDRFDDMLDPGDCSRAIDPNGRIMRCNPQGVLNRRLQEQLKHPDPNWTPAAQRALQTAVAEAERQTNGRVRTVDVRCGRDVCQILTVAPSADHDPPGGWDDATREFRRSAWWRELEFVDMRQSVMSGPDGRTVYYVTQLTTRPRP
jgi:hypothetical protein